MLTTELSGLSARVRAAEAAVATEQARLAELEASLAAERARLAALEQKIADETARLGVLERQYAAALARARAAPPRDLRVGRARSDLLRARDDVVLGPARQPRPLNRIGRQDERIASLA